MGNRISRYSFGGSMTQIPFANTVFLTGATGVLGGRLLRDLLRSTSAHVYCLVRGDDQRACTERLCAMLDLYDSGGLAKRSFDTRVTVLCGDVTLDRFGLPPEVYHDLQQTTQITVHAAANTSLLVKYSRLEPINVRGTGRIIEFCLGTPSRSLAYVSTYTVMGDKTFDRTVRFREQDYDLGQGFEHLNYQRSKFVAEGLVRAATDRGLRWRIFRPGQIYGDSTSGAYPQAHAQVSGLFYDLFKTAMDTGVMPDSHIHFDVVPVDYVSRGIVALAAVEDHVYGVFHLINPDVKSFAEVMALLRRRGYAIELLPEKIYQQRLRAGQITKNGEPYASTTLTAFWRWYFVARVSFHDSATTDCEFTRSLLEKLGVTCAPIDDRLIATSVDAGIRDGYCPPPGAPASAARADLNCEAPLA